MTKMDEASLYRTILEELYDGVYFVDRQKVVTFWNKGAQRLTGYTREEMIGAHCSARLLSHTDVEGQCMCNGRCPMSKVLATGQPLQAELFFHHKKGHRMPVLTRNSPIVDQAGSVIGAAQIFSDHSTHRELTSRIQELETLALLDPVTAQPNRRYLESLLSSRFNELRRYYLPFAVQMIDIDHFKEVNDRWGHDVGDAVLKMVAETLQHTLRAFDVIGRWGGDEFLAILPHIDHSHLTMVSERIRRMVEQSFLHQHHDIVRVTISVGATMACQSDTITTLLQRADSLLLEAKKLGRNQTLS
ncbi:MAG: GGDEF domain-containing protein [Bradymonadales bacterium]|nr:GGDEF domain-containing protein [Bradymonadales bacterium]